MGDQGARLGDFIRQGGPLHGQALHRLAVSCVAAMAKLHARGTAGLRLSHESVALGTRGQVLIGWQTATTQGAGAAAEDVRAWADLVVFAATGAEDGDVRVLPPALRIAVEECRRADTAARPRAVDVLRILLGQSVASAMASVDDLLSGTARRAG
ncbi:hypothetical protein SAMN05444920_104265 [Nonomuraea solani]|uniref:Protein kinase domain-containing protein n=1 Tax=Nonomuraea solani TaxID=1144553 RepID=A0A1H6CR81_9ACTN|nr:hypothetical protein [Nonomuraea solani]SEG75247.1 hypothetical protein SAMN05444920_104265 [Nonomuraea solani]